MALSVAAAAARAAADGWTVHAATYARAFSAPLSLFGRDALTLAHHLLPQPGSRVLDVACGAGAVTVPLIQHGFNVTALDHSAGMIQELQQTLAAAGLPPLPPADVHVGDGQTLAPLADDSFDAVVSNFGIFLFPDRAAGWSAARRVLKPGSPLVVTSWDATSGNFGFVLHLMAARPDPPPGPPPPQNATFNPEGFVREVTAAGFREVELETIRHEFVYASGREYLSALLDNPFIRSQIGERMSSDAAGMAEQAAGYYGSKGGAQGFLDRPLHFQGIAHVVTALK